MTAVTRRLLLTVLVAGVAVLSAEPAAGQSVEAQVDSVRQRLNAGYSSQLQLISPRNFQRAMEALRRAQKELEAGGSISQIRRRLEQAREHIAEAEKLREVGTVLLKEAIAAREDALTANAPDYAPELWSEASERLLRAGREVENGDQEDARDRAAEARGGFREAQVTAIERSLLGQARTLRSRAEEWDAPDRAPRTYSRADSVLRSAESLLRQDPSSQSRAGSLAEEAASEFRHAARIAAQADTFDTDGGVEELMLRAEAEIARLAETVDLTPRFADGLVPATEGVRSAIRSLQEDRTRLQEQIRELQEENEAARARIDSLRQRLKELGEARGEVAAQLEERRRREQRLRRIRGLFGAEEAEILTRGNDLILRIVGLQFASGSAEIRPEHFSLLTKAQQAIRTFPDASVTIQGHTDARGNDELNQSLSQRRAEAVRDYLLANMALTADDITARGYGETEPIATNETAEGRSRNRRIDIVLDLSE